MLGLEGSGNMDQPAPSPTPETFAAHRQDDNGNGFVVQTGMTRADAERLAAEFQPRGHKQD